MLALVRPSTGVAAAPADAWRATRPATPPRAPRRSWRPPRTAISACRIGQACQNTLPEVGQSLQFAAQSENRFGYVAQRFGRARQPVVTFVGDSRIAGLRLHQAAKPDDQFVAGLVVGEGVQQRLQILPMRCWPPCRQPAPSTIAAGKPTGPSRRAQPIALAAGAAVFRSTPPCAAQRSTEAIRNISGSSLKCSRHHAEFRLSLYVDALLAGGRRQRYDRVHLARTTDVNVEWDYNANSASTPGLGQVNAERIQD